MGTVTKEVEYDASAYEAYVAETDGLTALALLGIDYEELFEPAEYVHMRIYDNYRNGIYRVEYAVKKGGSIWRHYP